MKKIKNGFESQNFKKVIATVAKTATLININSTCFFVAYQPKLPKAADKLRKFVP